MNTSQGLTKHASARSPTVQPPVADSWIIEELDELYDLTAEDVGDLSSEGLVFNRRIRRLIELVRALASQRESGTASATSTSRARSIPEKESV